VTQISSTQDARRGSPRIQGDLVVWWDRRRGDRDIFAYDLANKIEFQIDVTDNDQDQPALTGSGPASVVWTDRDGDDWNIRGAQVTLAAAAQPTPTPGPTATPTPPAVAPADPNPTAPRDARYFQATGFRVDNDAIWDYFNLRGGVKNFGYPVSRTFRFLGFETQMFQRHVVQIGPEGPRLLNLLDPELMPYTQINQSTFPAFDPALAAQAPVVGSPGYDTAILEFVRRYALDEFAGQPVRFFETFMGQVDLATAFPVGGGNPALLPGFNLELAGSVTSLPLSDPNNGGFIYQRFQRVILHYDASCGCTQPILLADYFKNILMGQNLPPDLEAQASGSRFYAQYDNASPNGVRRPESLPGTNMQFAFEPQ
jgi:beta propeller repeat protein